MKLTTFCLFVSFVLTAVFAKIEEVNKVENAQLVGQVHLAEQAVVAEQVERVDEVEQVDDLNALDEAERKKRRHHKKPIVEAPVPIGLPKPSKCSAILEGILYTPETCVKEYMTGIAVQMRVELGLIMAAFSTGNLNFLNNYAAKYDIITTVLTPFGNPVVVTPTFTAGTSPIMGPSQAQSYLRKSGFYADDYTQYYNFQFIVVSDDAQYAGFLISLPYSKKPLCCY